MGQLYLPEGYLNQEYIRKTAAGNGCAFIVEIGGRQVGKTYGAIDLALRSGEQFLLMRRTQSEVDFISSGISSPFSEHDPEISMKKEGRYVARIRRGEDVIGMAAGLSSMAKIRGFSWREIKTVIYDEFIPERHVARIRDEGDAFVNAMITIGGNRELQGEPPVMCWLLANPNIHANPITETLGIVRKLDEMEVRGQEIAILKEKGIVIVRPSSEELMKRRRNIAIFRAAGTDSSVARMAIGNEFAYDDKTDVRRQNLQEFCATSTISGKITIWKHKSNNYYYVTDAIGEAGSVYYNNVPDLERFRTLWSPVIRTLERERRIFFADLVVKEFVHFAIGLT